MPGNQPAASEGNAATDTRPRRAFVEADFHLFDRVRRPQVTYAGMLQYDGDLQLPKRLIAARLSMQPETLSRTMARLRQAGLIESRGRHIHIPSVARLLAEFNEDPGLIARAG